MTRRGKAKSALAPIKDILLNLQLTKKEGARFRAATLNFMTKTKNLQVDDIIRLSEKGFYDLAREFLQTETTPGKGPTGSQYWPMDGFQRTLTYAANPSSIVKPVSYIMRNQRKSLLSTRNRQRRQTLPNTENHELDIEPGPSSSVAHASLQPGREPGKS